MKTQLFSVCVKMFNLLVQLKKYLAVLVRPSHRNKEEDTPKLKRSPGIY